MESRVPTSQGLVRRHRGLGGVGGRGLGRKGRGGLDWARTQHMPALDTPAMHTPCRRGLLGLNGGEREREQACYSTNLHRKEHVILVELDYGHVNKGPLL